MRDHQAPRALRLYAASSVLISIAILGCRPYVSSGESDNVPSPSPSRASVSGKSIIAPNGVLNFPIPQGQYDGTQNILVTDKNLTASNISAGVNIFGTVGNLVAENHVSCTASGQTGCLTNAGFPSGASQGNFQGPNGAKTVVIPQGYYDGTKTITAADSNLLATNIASGISIFGVAGSASLGPALCTSNGQSSCVVKGSFVASIPVGGNFTGANGSRVVTPTAGYYDGTTKTVTVTDTNLIASNIVSGKTIFGVSGVVIPPLPACNVNTLNTSACSAASNSYVSTVAGQSVQGGNGINSFYIPAGFQDGTKNCILSDTNLLARNIRSGVKIYGVTGTASCAAVASVSSRLSVYPSLNSNAFRDHETAPITQSAETTTYAGAALPAGYHEVPKLLKDDDGFEGINRTSSEIHPIDRASFVNCGNTQNSIAARISDCATLNGANATWSGETNGNSGQGTWKLVTRSAPNQEVWQDQRTGLLWSSVLSNSENWCRASGNAEASDPNGYCSSTTFQPSYPVAQSWCAESGPTTMKEVAGSGENWASGIYHPSKGGMGATPTPSSPPIHWRLPTRSDYLMADLNGIRFVLPDMIKTSATRGWIAMILANRSSAAWLFTHSNGQLESATRTDLHAVRCIGR